MKILTVTLVLSAVCLLKNEKGNNETIHCLKNKIVETSYLGSNKHLSLATITPPIIIPPRKMFDENVLLVGNGYRYV